VKTTQRRADGIPELRLLARGLAVLDCFSSERPSLSLTDLASVTHLPVPTAWRLVRGLVALGYLTRNEVKRYQPTVRTLALTQGSLGRLAFLNPYPRLGALASETGVGWVMHVLDGLETAVVAFGFAHAVQMETTPLGQRFPALTYAPGLAIVAFLPDAERELLLDRVGVPRQGRTRDDLRQQLNRVAMAGVAAVDNPPLAVVAAPVLDFQCRPVASVAVVAYYADANSSRLQERWGSTVKQVARELSAELGYPGPPG
jgi:IclR family pca regulon transcriptional regulator